MQEVEQMIMVLDNGELELESASGSVERRMVTGIESPENQKNKQFPQSFVAQARKISSLEEQVKRSHEMVRRMREDHEKTVEDLQTKYEKIIEGIQEQLQDVHISISSCTSAPKRGLSMASPGCIQVPRNTPTSPVRPRASSVVPEPASGSGRVRDARRVLLSILRHAMNDAMGMKKDKDIVAVGLASAEEAEEYETEEDAATVQPTLAPMRPFLPKARSPWNQRLWSLLAANLAKTNQFDEPTWEEVEDAFYARLTRLHGHWKSQK